MNIENELCILEDPVTSGKAISKDILNDNKLGFKVNVFLKYRV